MKLHEIDKMKAAAIKQYLKDLIEKLDELDQDDFFGTEGWRKYVMGEDE